jgi:hypothetical protein
MLMIIDMHTHAGRPSRSGPVDGPVLATMVPWGMAAGLVSAIADLPVIGRNPQAKRLGQVRDPVPGECLQAVDDCLASFAGTGMRIAREPRAGDPAAVGIDHVGIGTNLPAGAAREAMPDFCRHHEIAETLWRHGMTHDEVTKVRAGNWLRMFRSVHA